MNPIAQMRPIIISAPAVRRQPVISTATLNGADPSLQARSSLPLHVLVLIVDLRVGAVLRWSETASTKRRKGPYLGGGAAPIRAR